MNLGGEPERDDSGLPPVDIDVPDDARELDRDVQAYRRELRALRRRQRRMRLHRPLTRDGVVLPLLASCLVLALIAGTLLTVFASGQQNELPGASQTPGHGATASPTGSAPDKPGAISSAADTLTARTGAMLPAAAVQINGVPQHLVNYAPAVVALVPAGCSCTAAVGRLIDQSLDAHLKVVVFGTTAQLLAVRQLTKTDSASVLGGQDPSGALAKAYPHSQLTALLVKPGGSVGVAELSSPAFRLSQQLARLAASRNPASFPSSPRPGATSTTTASAPPSPSPSARSTTTAATTAAASPQPA